MVSKLIFGIICALIILTTLLYGAVHQPILAVFYAVTTAIVPLWAFEAFRSGKLRLSFTPLQIPLAVLIVYGIIQIIPFGSFTAAGVNGIARTISFEPFATQTAVLHFAALLVFFAALLVYVDSAARLRRLVYILLGFGFLYAFFAILQGVLSPKSIYGIYEPRFATPYGSFINRHNFAAFMEMAIAVPLGMILVGAVAKDKRLLYITAIALMGISIILSGSRGGLIALTAEVAALFFISSGARTYGQIVLKIAAATAFIGVVIGGAILVGGETSLTRFADSAASNDITANRAHIWNVTLQVIKNNPVFGVGLGAFPQAYTQFDSLNGLERVEQAHNDYLQVLSDAGIVGLLIGGAFVFLLFRTAFKNIKTTNTLRRGIAVGALGGCFAVLVHSLFDFVLHTTAVALMFLTLCGLIVAAGRKYSDEKEEKQTPKPRRQKSPASVTSLEERKAKIRELIENQ